MKKCISYKGYETCKKRRFCIGDKARVVIGGDLFVGVLVSIGRELTSTMPEFELEDGGHVFGYQCWWLPLDDAERLERGKNCDGKAERVQSC
ncbi:hypothetical protein [Acidiplasma sp.]|uniref:hypothetical protein n=1 Tax=Acidiplasma sp. TaxID=1872114 RepID=UPI0025865BE0|nr:hypothetical protein [Acidiplasma sp.]